MKNKLLKENGAVKVWVIVLVLALCLAIGGAIFAYVKINEDKDEEDDDDEDDEDVDEDEDDDEDEVDKKDSKKSDKKSSKERKFTAELDSSILGVEGMEWSMDIIGSDDAISKLVITIDMEDAAKDMYEEMKDEYDSYDDFLDFLHEQMESSLDGFEESFTSSAGISSSDIKGSTKWTDDEVLEMTIDMSKVDFSKADLDLNESGSVIETLVEYLEDEANVTFKEVK